MPTYTPKLNLLRPDRNDGDGVKVDVSLRENFDKIDLEFVNIDSQLAQTETQISSIQGEMIKGANGKKYKIVAGVLRRSGGVWTIYSDTIHQPINISSISSDAETIRIDFPFNAVNINALVCAPDETYTKHGINFGASVGTSNVLITPSIQKTIGGYISYNGTSWVISNAPGVTSVAFNSGTLTITHENMYKRAPEIYHVNVATRDGAYLSQLGSIGLTTAEVKFYRYDGTLVTTPDTGMKFYFTKTSTGKVHPDDLEIIGSNIWVYGIFEVS